jgi:hypothetical protein
MPNLPARLPAQPDQGEKLADRFRQFPNASIDNRWIGQCRNGFIEQFIERLVAARFDEFGSNSAEQRLGIP